MGCIFEVTAAHVFLLRELIVFLFSPIISIFRCSPDRMLFQSLYRIAPGGGNGRTVIDSHKPNETRRLENVIVVYVSQHYRML